MTESDGIEALLTHAYAKLSQSDTASAAALFDQALQCDFDHPEILFALKCLAWWQDSVERAQRRPDNLDAGDFLLAQWKCFRTFLHGCNDHIDRTCMAFKQLAFSLALNRYLQLLQEGEAQDAEISFRIGRCYKGIGNYELAIKFIENATRLVKDDPAYLAELADIYALIDETRAAKALFREAFYLNPQRIELDLLESAVISRLQDKAIESGHSGHETVEWIPVYAEISGVFSVKRELKPIEASRLKNTIYELETELSNDGSRRAVLLPRLINKYFWLIDHYVSVKEEKARIDEILLKIKLMDAAVYKLYVA